MAGRTKKNVVSTELLISTHSTADTALFLFKSRNGPIELHVPRSELKDLIQAAGKILAQPITEATELLQDVEPAEPGEMSVSKEAQQLVIRFTTKEGDPQAFRFDRANGLHVARLLMESASVGGMPWGRGRR